MAWALIGGGAGAALLGLVLLTRFGLAAFRGEVFKDMAGWGTIDIASIDPAMLRRSLSDMWKEDPRLAAQADEGLLAFEELRRSQPDQLPNVQRLVRMMYVARLASMALVGLGVVSIAAGVWLRAS